MNADAGLRTKQGDSSLFAAVLTPKMRRLLWTLAQHKYGWCYCHRGFGSENRYPTAKALERRGLVVVFNEDAGARCEATDEGRSVIAALFPVSPFILRTYDHQPGGWPPPEGVS